MKLAYQIREASDAIGIGVTQIYNFINSGELQAIKIGGRTVILAEALTDFLKSRPKV
jgi:excisionase family DNA binding protein